MAMHRPLARRALRLEQAAPIRHGNLRTRNLDSATRRQPQGTPEPQACRLHRDRGAAPPRVTATEQGELGMDFRDFNVEVNGQPGLSFLRPAPLWPGRRNTMVVSFTHPPGKAECAVTLDVIAPDGRRRTESARLTGDRVSLDIGPLTSPTLYDYEHGALYRRGYRLHLRVEEPTTGDLIMEWGFLQGLTQDPECERLHLGDREHVLYNDGYIPEGKMWHPMQYSGAPMDPPISLRLHPSVLVDQDQVVVMYRLREKPAVPGPITALLVARDANGKEMFARTPVSVTGEWQELPLSVADWPTGDYRIELWPEIGGRVYEDGPWLCYRRRERRATDVPVSPLAPFRLKLDASRPVREYSHPAAVGKVGEDVDGWYAVFVQGSGSYGFRVAGEPFIRRLTSMFIKDLVGEIFVAAADLTGRCVEVIDEGADDGVLEHLRLVPVTEASVKALRKAAEQPPSAVRGVEDWGDYFMWIKVKDKNALDESEIDAMLEGQREVGVSSSAWSLGRSTLCYRTKLTDVDRRSVSPWAPGWTSIWPDFTVWGQYDAKIDAWEAAVELGRKRGIPIYGWLCLNRHYMRGALRSRWAESHPEFHHVLRDGYTRDITRLEFFFEEVRQERLNVFGEALTYGPDGICIGCCRQPPMASHNPRMVEAYIRETGDDPRDLDVTDGERYFRWIRWRAQWLTLMLRELRKKVQA
ncbi:MAG: hypothetical protein JW940_03040, partial [Polyangiaceae bacterium]|nr:hypothetical protein [Polyangiaceae bacterium]